MKLRLPIIAPLLFIASISYSQTSHKQLEVEKVAPQKGPCVEIPSTFSHETLSQSKSLKELQSKKIRRIELVYTSYKESADFDQNQLNEDRMYRLNQLLPKLQIDKPEVVWIEQTGATTREEAKNYFHGFRIYTDATPDMKAYHRTNLKDAGNPATDFSVDNSKGGVFTHPNGSQIHIPANAVVYANGKPVYGNYTVSYTEYRNPAEILFSGLPMDFKDKTGSYLFNSAGMYELRGTKDGQKLTLQKDISVDFNCTKKAPGVNFYEMDDQTGEWTVLKKDLFAPANNNQEFKLQKVLADNNDVEVEIGQPREAKISYVTLKPYTIVTLDEDTREAYRRLAKKSPQKVEESVAQDLTADFQLKVRPEYAEPLIQLIWDEYNANKINNNQVHVNRKMAGGKNNTLLPGGGDKGHQYPNLVSGLNCEKFGVYNCDQIYQVANAISFSPKYLDASTQKEIKNQHILCLIDKGVNGSFSFDPKQIMCNAKGENIFLLFTEGREVYSIRSEKDKLIDLNAKTPEFRMENITNQVKTSDDLKNYLAI
ncbi:hypothetical protein [Fluviicola taffensis]|uniref:hypothetical protein n=1 Tax=Fluviicola taffensis TaxID=191579 RepID=UPI0031381A20